MDTLNTQKKVNLFIDSGAYSAKTQGISINIDEYISFIYEYKAVIDVYANLDVIGDPKATYANQLYMEKAGLSPLPVFHYGEDFRWLEKYLLKGYPYIAIGGLVKTPRLTGWLDALWGNYLIDENHLPKIKVHAFGMTSLNLMLRYPWYSVDSTSWVMTGRLGSIYVPQFRNGQYQYDEQSYKICVSNKSTLSQEAGKHFDTLSNMERQKVIQYLHELGYEYGKSEYHTESIAYTLKEDEKWADTKKDIGTNKVRQVETIITAGVSNMYQLRDEVNILYFLALEKSIPTWPHPFILSSQSTPSLLW